MQGTPYPHDAPAGAALHNSCVMPTGASLPPSEFPVPASQVPRWHLRVLGALELRDGAAPPLRLPSRAVALLLARLALHPQRQHAREELVDLLWPGAGADVGRNRLRQALSVLRSLLEPPGQPAGTCLQADRRAVWLSPSGLPCDAIDFLQAAASGDAIRARRLYQGDLLPGFFEDWVLEERRHLAEQCASLAVDTPGAAASGLALTPAPAAAEASPALPPPPSAPTASAADAAWAQDARLPLYLTRLVGFEADGAQLAAALRHHRLVLLRGPGGAGKTRLAVEVARALAQGRSWWPGGVHDDAPDTLPSFDLVCFVPLASCTTRAQMLDALLLALRHESDHAAADESERVVQALSGRRVLLVLDNFEQLVEAGRADLSRWLSRLPDLQLLVTSRRVLAVDGEFEHALGALPLPQGNAALDRHALNPAVTLFVERARAVRADFHLTERNHAQVAEVVSALHGLPLAIELAAARVRSLGLSELHALLTATGDQARGLDLLARSGPRAADDARHASMLRVLAWSWQQLSAAEQALLSALAACDGGASLALLSLLAGQEKAHTAVTVDNLLAASVAYRREGPGGDSRFHAFEPMREFVFHQAGPGGVAQLRAGHAQAVAVWAAGLGREPDLPAVQAEWPNVLRAIGTAADTAVPGALPQRAIDTALAARHALVDLPLQPGALTLLRRCADAAPGHRTAELQALLAMHSFQVGQRDEAAAHAQAALAAVDRGAPEAAEVLRSTALVRLRLGEDLAGPQAQLEEALALARARGDTDVEAHSLTHLAVVAYRQQRDPVLNVQRYTRALALWRAHGPRARVASGTTSLAIALGVQHRVQEQLALLHEARRLAEAQGQPRLQAFTMSVTAYALDDQKRHAEAALLYRQCLLLDWDQGFWREWFYVLWNLPRALAHLRQPQAAARLMGFAEAFYAQRFGVLGREDLPEARRTRRLVAAQVGAAAAAAIWRAGAALGMAEAQQLALAETAPLLSAGHPRG